MLEKIKSMFGGKPKLYRLEKHTPGIVGWSAIMEFPKKISRKEAEEHFEPGNVYRLVELDQETGKFKRKVWEHSTLLPRMLRGEETIEEKKKEKREPKEPSAIDVVEAGKAWLMGVLEDVKMIRELVRGLQEGVEEGGGSKTPIRDAVKDYLRQVKEDYEAIYGRKEAGLTISELMKGKIPENVLSQLPASEMAKTLGDLMKVALWREVGTSLIDYGAEKLKEIKEGILPTRKAEGLMEEVEPLSPSLFKKKEVKKEDERKIGKADQPQSVGNEEL